MAACVHLNSAALGFPRLGLSVHWQFFRRCGAAVACGPPDRLGALLL